jgi:F0F1-type ATP synthase alpha subunit
MIDDLDEDTLKVLELSQEILELIEQNIVNFSAVESETIATTNESIQFFLEQENVERALTESLNLKKYLLKITDEI